MPNETERVQEVLPVPSGGEAPVEIAKLTAQVDELLKRQAASENQLAGARRIQERLQRQVEEAVKAPPVTAVPGPVEVTPELLEKLVEDGKWQVAVDKITEHKVNTILSQRDALAKQEHVLQESRLRQDAAKREVIALYPELDPATGNEEAPESRAFNEVLNAHPEFLQNDYGPILAMHEAERLLASRGMTPRSWSSLQKPTRSTSTALPPSRGGKASGPYILTVDERAYCDHTGLSYAKYAQSRQQAEQTGGVEAT